MNGTTQKMKNQKMEVFHTPVLLNEVVRGLRIQKNNWYIDATAGGGGHSEQILKDGGNVVAIDQDASAISYIRARLHRYEIEGRLRLVQGNFRDIQTISSTQKLSGISGILFDLGMSTYQIKQSGRGFSFLRDEPLDMRMSSDGTVTAYEIINTYSSDELTTILTRYGEEILAKKITEAITQQRKVQSIKTTAALATLVSEVYQRAGRHERIHPATRTFQALRIAVNEELTALSSALSAAVSVLSAHGRLEVISFHSLEDRMVKQFFQKTVANNELSLITKKPMTATEEEISENPKARSAKLRIAEKN